MARETKWCQNPKCPEKKLSNQMRGAKGNKYYQSNKANGYGNGNFCTLGCYDTWSNIYLDRAIDAIGVRINDPVKVNMENAWLIDQDYNYSANNSDSRWHYFLVNKLFNIREPITPRQALNVEPDSSGYNGWHDTKTSAQAKELAQQLGLTNQK
tara:strand:+ start:226 stop:687 length:462 start_codon:yes stop_codon:yes gene_type:complete